jgi:hypothetical protein
MMIEIVVAPPSGIGIALRILDRHIGAIEGSGEIVSQIARLRPLIVGWSTLCRAD